MNYSEIQQIIDPELQTDEKVIWTGKPMRFPIVFDSIFGLAFVFLWVALTLGNPEFPFLFQLAGPIFFIAVVSSILKPSRDIYGLTNRRGFVITRLVGNHIHFISDSDIRSASLAKEAQIGTLKFNFTKFHNIEYPNEVMDIIRKQFLTSEPHHE